MRQCLKMVYFTAMVEMLQLHNHHKQNLGCGQLGQFQVHRATEGKKQTSNLLRPIWVRKADVNSDKKEQNTVQCSV